MKTYALKMLTVLEKPTPCLDFNQGFAKLLGGCEATVLIESDHGGSRIFGDVKTKFLQRDELVLDAELENGSPEVLATLLHAQAKSVATEKAGEYDLGPALWEMIKAGKPLLA